MKDSTSRFWRVKFGAPIARLVSSFSLLLVVCIALAGPFADLQKKLDAVKTPEAKERVLSEFATQKGEDTAFKLKIRRTIQARKDGMNWSFDDIYLEIELNASAEQSAGPASKEDVRKVVRDIMGSHPYRDPSESQSSNWLNESMRNMGSLIDRMLRANPNTQISPPSPGQLPNWTIPGINPAVLNLVAWGVIGVIVASFLWWAIRHFSWKRTLKRRAKALLEDDEPERSLDEWLEQADLLASQGKHREAVRALYLACLLRFDEAGVARFLRGETNWEHLVRIHKSPQKPADIDFTAPTHAFDAIWYGHRVKGSSDVVQFRSWYVEISQQLKPGAA